VKGPFRKAETERPAGRYPAGLSVSFRNMAD
jgi:hypothetical protein